MIRKVLPGPARSVKRAARSFSLPSGNLSKRGYIRVKGRENLNETLRYYNRLFEIPPKEIKYFKEDKKKGKIKEIIEYSDKTKRRELNKFLEYWDNNARSGRLPVKIRGKAYTDFAARFAAAPPPYSKVVMLPKSFKNIRFKGGKAVIKSDKFIKEVYPLDFITDEFEANLEFIIDQSEPGQDSTDLLIQEIEKYLNPWLANIPDGKIYALTLATGDYAKGSTFDKETLKEFLIDYILRFIRSKGVAELKNFVAALVVLSPA